jgi:hypothetical protein
MTPELSAYAARLRGLMAVSPPAISPAQFDRLALELFALQFQSNPAYRKICEARGQTPATVQHWSQIPAVPTAAFKDLDLTCLAPTERTAVFHSSGTTEQRPSRHFHSAESLSVYEVSLWAWFAEHFPFPIANCQSANGDVADKLAMGDWPLAILTPPPVSVPHSSLAHMFEVIRQKLGAPESAFLGRLADDGAWTLDFAATSAALLPPRAPSPAPPARLLLGTAFSFVHLLDYLVERDLRVELPPGSLVMETGGYKNRSRVLPKSELHALITERLGVPPAQIFCEYGMSELSSQAYDGGARGLRLEASGSSTPSPKPQAPRRFSFPPWARAQIISPETGQGVGEGETGLIRILDLANVFSVLAVQTEDLGVRRGDGFELIGRAQLAEPRGCSLMNA